MLKKVWGEMVDRHQKRNGLFPDPQHILPPSFVEIQ